jgi:hypothetical protein
VQAAAGRGAREAQAAGARCGPGRVVPDGAARIMPLMHLVIPFAAPLSEAGRHALRGLQWPHLKALLAGRPAVRDDGDALSLSPPHERVLAAAWGWQGDDGRYPFAARAAAADGIAVGERAWGLITPAHWHVGTEQLSLTDPATLMLDADSSRQCFDAVADLFTSEGFELHWGAPERWYLSHPSLADLATASLDRVIGRNVDRWLPDGAQASLLRRLQNEVQMVLYTHALNDEREARRLPTINSFWLSGCGVSQAAAGDVQLDERLRRCALAEDWAGWAKAWAQIDEELGLSPPQRLSLCGERSAWSVELPARTWWGRVSAGWRSTPVADLLESL